MSDTTLNGRSIHLQSRVKRGRTTLDLVARAFMSTSSRARTFERDPHSFVNLLKLEREQVCEIDKMTRTCALCKQRSDAGTHMFPQNSRPDVQLKWVQALQITQEKEDEILAEMRAVEDSGRQRPRWCTYHFTYDEAGAHEPKYFDPEEGRANRPDDEDEEEAEESKEEDKDDVAAADDSQPEDGRRRSARVRAPPKTIMVAAPPKGVAKKRPAAAAAAATATVRKEQPLSLMEILGMTRDTTRTWIVPGGEQQRSHRAVAASAASKREIDESAASATTSEKTLQSILMEAGLPVPDSLQAKTGVSVKEEIVLDDDEDTSSSSTIARQLSHPKTIGEAKRAGLLMQSSNGRLMLSPQTATAGSSGLRIGLPKIVPKMAASCYNHHTMEKYDDADSLRRFRMSCLPRSSEEECRSELTVIMARARALEDHFEELAENVMMLVEMYRTKEPMPARPLPSPSLATLMGRAVNTAAAPSFLLPPRSFREDSLSQKERRERKAARIKQPLQLLTDDDLAASIRKEVEESKEGYSEAIDDDEEEEEEGEEREAPDLDYTPDDESEPLMKRPRRVSSRDAATSDEAVSPPMLEAVEE